MNNKIQQKIDRKVSENGLAQKSATSIPHEKTRIKIIFLWNAQGKKKDQHVPKNYQKNT